MYTINTNRVLIILVNGVVATMETVVRENELVTHKVHRHEPPVIATPLNIVHKDEDLIVLDKPASIPVSLGCGCNLRTVSRTSDIGLTVY